MKMNNKSPRELWLETRVDSLERELKHLKRTTASHLKYTEFKEPLQINVSEKSVTTITLCRIASVNTRKDDVGYHVITRFTSTDGKERETSYHVSNELLLNLHDSERLHVLSGMIERTLIELITFVHRDPNKPT